MPGLPTFGMPCRVAGVVRPSCTGLTIGTGPVQVETMGDLGVVMFADEIGGMALECARAESDGSPTPPAQQVMAVFGRPTQPVEQLAVFGTLSFGDPVVGKTPQDAVHAGQADADRPFVQQLLIELLGATEVVVAAQRVLDRLLFGRSSPRLRRGCGHEPADPPNVAPVPDAAAVGGQER